TDDGRLLAFDFETGRPTWFASIGENPGEAGVWTALRSDLLFVGGRRFLGTVDAFDGQMVWKISGDLAPDDPLGPSPLEMTDDGVLIVVPANDVRATTSSDGRKAKASDTREFIARIYSGLPPAGPTKLASAVVRLGSCPHLRGVFPYDGALIVVDGRRIVGYVGAK